MNKPIIQCCFCNKTIYYQDSNNPEPVKSYTCRCCNKCNKEIVLPARVREWMNH